MCTCMYTYMYIYAQVYVHVYVYTGLVAWVNFLLDLPTRLENASGHLVPLQVDRETLLIIELERKT